MTFLQLYFIAMHLQETAGRQVPVAFQRRMMQYVYDKSGTFDFFVSRKL